MRILTAIMFTDIEGFTSLMQRDEAKAIRLLERHKKIFLQYTEQHKGRVIKYIGDGTLTIFNSVFDAISCAVAMQQAFQKNPVIPVRIGIHTGEVLFEKKDVIGDAVNLASRIQTKGIAGSVLVSEKVHEELINHPEIATEHLGAFHLKNVVNPVHLYAIVAKGLKVPAEDAMAAKENAQQGIDSPPKGRFRFPGVFGNTRAFITVCIIIFILVAMMLYSNYFKEGKELDTIKTIAVVPFKNIGTGGDTFLAEGMAEEMISLLSENPGLSVKNGFISNREKYTDNEYEKKLLSTKATYVLEGSFQVKNDTLVIIPKLWNIETNEVIWSDIIKVKRLELIKAQEDVAGEICRKLFASFGEQKLKQFPKKNPDPEAHELYLKGRYAQKKRDSASLREAGYFFEQAIEKDPAFALPYSGISDNYTLRVDNGLLSYDSGMRAAQTALDKAFSLDSNIAEVRASYAIFLTTLEGRRKEAMHELQVALALRPGYEEAHQWYAVELAADGQFEAAIAHINIALDLYPYSERIWDQKIMILTYARRFREAINTNDSFNDLFPGNSQSSDLITECYFGLGKMDSALISAAKVEVEFNDFWKAVINNNREKIHQLIASEVSEGMKNKEELATYYTVIGEYGNAVKILEYALAGKEYSWLKFLNVAPAWDPLRKEPGFEKLLFQMGFK